MTENKTSTVFLPINGSNKHRGGNKRPTVDIQIRIGLLSNKRFTLASITQCFVSQKFDHNLTVIKFIYIWRKYLTYKKLKITSNSGIYGTVYDNGSLFGKKTY